jgi:hypothetical protein
MKSKHKLPKRHSPGFDTDEISVDATSNSISQVTKTAAPSF